MKNQVNLCTMPRQLGIAVLRERYTCMYFFSFIYNIDNLYSTDSILCG
jgi:hypothetical protein